jgi:O-antigen/teichoic acid export membrane protein
MGAGALAMTLEHDTPAEARTPFSVIAKGAAGSAGLKIVNLFFGLLATAFLGRVLMPQQYGFYAFASTVVTLLALPVQCGLPQLMTREIAKYHLVAQWGHIRGLLLRANQLVGLLGLCVVAALVLLLPALKRFVPAVDGTTFAWAIVLLPLIALNRVRGGALLGLRKVALGLLPDNGVRSVLFLAFIVAWRAFLPFGSATAMALQVAATLIAFLAGAVLLMYHLPKEVRSSRPAFESKSWFSAIIPLTLTDAVLIFNLQADLLLLGVLGNATEVGIYRAVTLVATQVTIGLTVANEALAPQVARLHQAKDRAGLQALLKRVLGWLTLSGVVLAGICILFGQEIIVIVFGKAYAGGATALAILACGALISVAAGTGAVLLNMSGHERDVLRIFAVSAVVNVAANIVMIPLLGMTGAAIATVGCQLFTNGLLVYFVRRRLGLSYWSAGL